MSRPLDPANAAPRGPRRRDLLAGALALAACARPPRPAPPRFDQPIVVDIHCHDFNAADLPITGFLARTLPGLAELSRTVTPIPEQILRLIVGTIHGWLNAGTPSASEEQALLQRALLPSAPAVTSPRGFVDVGDDNDGRALANATAPVPPPPFSLPIEPLEALVDRIAALFPVDARRLREGIGRLAETLYLVGHGRARIAASLAQLYPQVALFTPLLVDYDAWSDDRPGSPLCAQIPTQELLAKLSIRGRVGRPDARFHPFIAFDPLREALAAPASNAAAATRPPPAAARRWESPAPALPPGAGALALVRQAIAQAGFVGVKLYPPVGFLPLGNADLAGDAHRGRALDQALRALYAYCQAEDVPITTHASPSNEYALGLRELAAPERWAPVLREFPALRLNFGHFGHDNGAGGARGVEAREAWMRQAAALIQDHAHVYADLSGSPLVYDEAYARRWGAQLQTLCARYTRLPSRLMYGSDWWLNRFDPGAGSALTVFARRLEGWLGARGRDDVMGRNALRFLGFIDEGDRLALDNRNRQRLRAFYGAEPAPAWLA